MLEVSPLGNLCNPGGFWHVLGDDAEGGSLPNAAVHPPPSPRHVPSEVEAGIDPQVEIRGSLASEVDLWLAVPLPFPSPESGLRS